MYEEGLVRFAAKKYTKNSTKEEEFLTNTYVSIVVKQHNQDNTRSLNKKYAALKLLTWTFRKLKVLLYQCLRTYKMTSLNSGLVHEKQILATGSIKKLDEL